MKRHTLLLALATLLTFVACEKDPQPTPGGTDNPGGDTHAPAHVFTVAEGHQVILSPGNLQYCAATNSFRFAPHAWDAAKEENSEASPTYAGWIDFFGYGTSGYNGYEPYVHANTISAYYTGGDLTGTEYDWGQHNAIQNGSATDPAGTWRTLTSEEWDYMLHTRTASTLNGVENARFITATVVNQPGLLIFPDVFEMPEGLSLPQALSINIPAAYIISTYSEADWQKLQDAGCAFLPASGCLNVVDNTAVVVDYLGCYWTANFLGYVDDMTRAEQLWFNPNLVEIGSAGVQYARNVRLAQDVR